ncbi:31061_t:CDS:2, partial [Gigaspora margarita]
MPKDLLKEKSGSEPYKKKREIFTTSKIDFYIAMKGWQLNLHILKNSLVNCFPTLDEPFKRTNEWLEKYYKGINTGISMGIKNLKDLEVKFVKESIEE